MLYLGYAMVADEVCCPKRDVNDGEDHILIKICGLSCIKNNNY